MTFKGVQRSGVTMTTRSYHMGSCHRTTTRSANNTTRTSTSLNTSREGRSPQTRCRTFRKRNDTSIMGAICSKSFLCQKERWQTSTYTRLPTGEQMDKEKSKCLPTHTRSNRPTQWMHPLYKI